MWAQKPPKRHKMAIKNRRTGQSGTSSLGIATIGNKGVEHQFLRVVSSEIGANLRNRVGILYAATMGAEIVRQGCRRLGLGVSLSLGLLPIAVGLGGLATSIGLRGTILSLAGGSCVAIAHTGALGALTGVLVALWLRGGSSSG